MPARGAVPALMLAAVVAIAGCDRRVDEAAHRNNTAVLGGYGPPPSAAPTLSDASGQLIPPPPAPAKTPVHSARSGDEQALAVWIQDGHVVASVWTRAGGWSAPQALERIYGQSSDAQVVSNGRGSAMAVWQHRVGNIHSLRFSRFDAAAGWSLPDVIPGALPQPNVSGRADGPEAPQLQMDDQGNVLARWPSGFQANEMQTAHYTPAAGWTPATGAPVASAQNASPGLPPASSGR